MRILVVDDDPVTRLTLETMLARRGCEVITAVDGEELTNCFNGTMHQRSRSSTG